MTHRLSKLQKPLLNVYTFTKCQSRNAGGNVKEEIKGILSKKIPESRNKIKELRKNFGKQPIGEITIDMIYGGMRGLLGLICETSHLDPIDGITYRGLRLYDVMEKLPKINSQQPLPEGVYWLLLTGDIPTAEQVKNISKFFADNSRVPGYVMKILDETPKEIHPLAQLSAAITLLHRESKFFKAYRSGTKKTDYWQSVLEDALEMFARIPVIAAQIYRNVFKDGGKVEKMDPSKCITQNFCEMCGYKDPLFTEMMRMYFILHCDHANGNVAAHTAHLVGSALSDPYLAYASGINGLSGPLHGMAAEEVLRFMFKLKAQLGVIPSNKELEDWLKKHLKSGQVIPGYGHAVLRRTDPRFVIQQNFALKHLPKDELVKLCHQLYKVVPPLLKALGKVANPWPNVDAHSGVLLQHYGMREFTFYTVLFGISRAMGILSQLVWNRAMLSPIERPTSISTELLMKKLGTL